MFKNKSRCCRLAKFLLLFVATCHVTSINAAVLSFNDFQHVGSDEIDYIVLIEDDAEAGVMSGGFRITYQVAGSSPNTVGKLTGLFLDFGHPNDLPITFSMADLNFNNESADHISCGQAFNTDSITAGGGCNTQLQLGSDAGAYQAHQFDIAIAWKKNNVNSFGESSFEISKLGFNLMDISAVALRGQNTSGTGGSAKDFAVARVIPVPGAILFFLSGIVGLIGIKELLRASQLCP